MRMVQHENEWKLHNTRTRDIELLEEMGFNPQESFPVSRK